MHCFNHSEINVQCVHKIHGSIDLFLLNIAIPFIKVFIYLLFIFVLMHCKRFRIPHYWFICSSVDFLIVLYLPLHQSLQSSAKCHYWKSLLSEWLMQLCCSVDDPIQSLFSVCLIGIWVAPLHREVLLTCSKIGLTGIYVIK